MIEISRRVSKARSSNERILAFSLWLSVLASGLYYKQAWLFLGGILGFYALVRGLGNYLYLRLNSNGFSEMRWNPHEQELGLPELDFTSFMLLGMAGLSALGLLHPVRAEEGLLEVLRWLVYWFVYSLGAQIRRQGYSSRLLKHIRWAALAVAVIGWFPWAGLIWPNPPLPEAGRLSSVFGYPNAAAAFLGLALFIPGSNFLAKALLAVSFLSTGSRAALAAFLLVFFLKWLEAKTYKKKRLHFLDLLNNNLKKVLTLILIIAVSIKIYPSAWEHLSSWSLLSPSIGQRLLYYRDGLLLAWQAQGLPRAGGWLAFPRVQIIPYWTSHPHSSLIQLLLNQGVIGLALMGMWTIWVWRKLSTGAEKWGMLFLAVHSLFDADVAFGALGLVFWILCGLITTESNTLGFYQSARRRLSARWKLWVSSPFIRSAVYILAALYLFLLPTLTLTQPELLDPGKAASQKAARVQGIDPEAGAELWRQSLNWDQTQISWRRQMAELKLAQGKAEDGLAAVEEVLAWRSFDLTAYEWAQGAVLKAADTRLELKKAEGLPEKTEAALTPKPEDASGDQDIVYLYQWVQGTPEQIREKQKLVPEFARRFWPEWESFKPTPAVNYMAEYAKGRILTPANS